jgi:hypothetical protein
MTPLWRDSGGRQAIAWDAPRNLNAPVFWNTSAAKNIDSGGVVSEFIDEDVKTGVLWRTDWMRE